MKKIVLAFVMAAASFVASSPVTAAILTFNVTGPQVISFELDSSPTPSDYVTGRYIRFDNLSGSVNGAAARFGIGFGNGANTASFGFLTPSRGSSFTTPGGMQYYTGTEEKPVFKVGTFALTNGYSLTIADAAGAVPEPATWTMTIVGMGAVGFAMRRRRATTKVAYA